LQNSGQLLAVFLPFLQPGAWCGRMSVMAATARCGGWDVPNFWTTLHGDIRADAESKIMRALQILLVEDHLDTARSMARLLEQRGHQVAVAHCAADGLALAAKLRFELLLCDIGLPDRDGWQLLEDIRKLYPIVGIAISGYGMNDDIDRSRQTGFAAHVTKPSSLQQLLKTIDDVMARPDAISDT
jgi:CheY-like chemotaxis protein